MYVVEAQSYCHESHSWMMMMKMIRMTTISLVSDSESNKEKSIYYNYTSWETQRCFDEDEAMTKTNRFCSEPLLPSISTKTKPERIERAREKIAHRFFFFFFF